MDAVVIAVLVAMTLKQLVTDELTGTRLMQCKFSKLKINHINRF